MHVGPVLPLRLQLIERFERGLGDERRGLTKLKRRGVAPCSSLNLKGLRS